MSVFGQINKTIISRMKIGYQYKCVLQKESRVDLLWKRIYENLLNENCIILRLSVIYVALNRIIILIDERKSWESSCYWNWERKRKSGWCWHKAAVIRLSSLRDSSTCCIYDDYEKLNRNVTPASNTNYIIQFIFLSLSLSLYFTTFKVHLQLMIMQLILI